MPKMRVKKEHAIANLSLRGRVETHSLTGGMKVVEKRLSRNADDQNCDHVMYVITVTSGGPISSTFTRHTGELKLPLILRCMGSEENETSLEISEPDTQFVPREDDDQQLFRVIEITDENSKGYKVKWAGKDPKTKRPWPQSWVPKHDCTNDLVHEWKKKKARMRASGARHPHHNISPNRLIDFPASNTPISEISKALHYKSTTQSPSTKAQRSRGKRTTLQANPVWDDPPTAGPSVKKRKTAGNPQPSRENKRRKIREVYASEDGSAAEVHLSDIDEKPNRRSPGRGKVKGEESGSKQGPGGPTPVRGKEKVTGGGQPISNSPPSPRQRPATTKLTHGLRVYTGTSDVDNSVDSSDDTPPVAEVMEKPSPTRSNTRTSQEDCHLRQDLGLIQPVLLQNESGPISGANAIHNLNAQVAVTRPVSPLLSPGAVARLKEYDDFCREVDEEEQRMRAEETVKGSPACQRSPQTGHGGVLHSGFEKNGTLPLPTSFKPSSPDQESPQSRTAEMHLKIAVDASEIVPETETQSSTNTQRPPERVTLVSKMRPRSSPSKASILSSPKQSVSSSNEREKRNGSAQDKSLKPVPVVSPSHFVPYLQTVRPEREDVEDVDDTIEQFSSPEKGTTTRALSPRSRKEAQTRKDRQDSARVREEGLAMSEKARKARVWTQNGGGPPKKRTLSQVARSAHSCAEGDDVALDIGMDDPIDDHLISEGPDNVDFHYNDRPAILDSQNPSLETGASSPVSLKRTNTSKVASNYEGKHPLTEELKNALNKLTVLENALAKERSERYLQRELPETLREKNEQICRLETNVRLEKEEKQVLLAKIETLEETLAVARLAAVVSSDPTPDVLVTTGFAEELKAALNKAQSDKTSLEKDRDFFREEWSKASGFVTEVRKENIELEQRVQIAESQAKEGVAMVKATFQERIKFLEDNAKQAYNLASFIMEKDKRTNDEIRRRAAQEPELRKQVESLEGELESRDLQIEALEASLQSTTAEKEKHLGTWKAEVVRLTKDLNMLKTERDRAGQNHDDPEKQVFRCMLMDNKGQGLCHYYSDTREVRIH
ncbi:hypothetical protein E1B28_006030 [Marasmius oreades]|uniref:Chromo domain-containing protein n=1 Tax=Marasmius oreades TaxID=181124 RepID=A0A9P7S535_9AGAR|nr:uncharacterized protein E1B28_006030 [Marasmius oreades]KAG7095257.1 hypothetical protein E1B28_006030 [Marasmius oreades]